VERLDYVYVGRMGSEMLFQEQIDGALDHGRIVDGDHADVGLEIPARLASARLRGVHDVVQDEEHGLQQLDQPAERGGME
jgi:hypothetical protein